MHYWIMVVLKKWKTMKIKIRQLTFQLNNLVFFYYLHSPFLKILRIFGRNNKHNVAVVLINMNDVIMIKDNVTRSASKFASTTTLALVITTL